MAIGVFKLSKGQRFFLSILFGILNMLQVLTGLLMLSLSIYVYVSIAPMLYSERAEVTYVFTVVAICGLNHLCCYLFGLKIRWKCLNQAYKKSTRNLVFAWACLTFYIDIYLGILAKHTTKVYKHIVRSMAHSFFIGMSKYLHNEDWKVTIDEIQYRLQCCGSHNYTEWYETPWMNKYHVNDKSETVKQFHANGSWLFPVTPWSCCRLSFPMQCLHDPLQQVRSLHIFSNQQSVAIESLNTDGCVSKLKIPIKWALTGFVLVVVLNCILQLLIFLLLRLLYTSSRNAAILGDPEGVAPGWIFGRGDCGYNRGKTLGEIMHPSRIRTRPSITKEEERLIPQQIQH